MGNRPEVEIAVSLPFAMVRHGRDDVPVLLGLDRARNMAGLDLVDGRFLALDPGDVGTIMDTDPAAVYFGVQLAWALAAPMPLAAEAVVIPMRAELGRKFEPLLTTDPFSVPVSGFDEVRAQLLRHRAEVPSVETIRLTAIFAGLTVGVGIAQAEKGFRCLVDLFQHTKGEPPIEKVRDCIWSLGYHRIRERLYSEAPRWAPVCQEAIRNGLKDRELREHLFLHTDLPAGLSLAKLSFVLALLGHNLVCLDVRILDRMFGPGMASRYSGMWDTKTQLSLARYERTEDAFLRGNPFYRPNDPVGRARAQWMSWESAGAPARVETHATWLNVVR
jgi:hypothetical protein